MAVPRERERKEAKRARKKRRKEEKRKREKLKLRADGVKSSADTISPVENNYLATKMNCEVKKNSRGSSRSIFCAGEKQAEKEKVARSGSSITATKIKLNSWDERLMKQQL